MSTVTISEDLLKSELQNLVSLASDETVQVNNTAGHNYIITIESDHGRANSPYLHQFSP